MKIGYMVGEATGAVPSVVALVERGQRIEAAGLDTAWISEVFLDAATTRLCLRTAPCWTGKASTGSRT